MLYVGRSSDGVNWTIDHQPISFEGDVEAAQPFEYGYDPRVTKIDDRYYVTWCNGYQGQPTIGLAWTTDFKTFTRMENAFLPFNRNGVLFPKKIDGKYLMLSRPSDPGHTSFGEIYVSQSPDLTCWGKHRFVMRTAGGWQGTKIGAGPVPIETSEGWLMIYHGVLTSCNGMVYSMGAALLDIDQPWKVLHRTAAYLLSPQMIYECVGDTPNVVFPVATLSDASTGRIAIYYGAADTVTCLAYTQVDELIEFIKANDMPAK
jgi:beta-1,4-mannooligosaccharide/beta-1,4-mannosyl-N-acetylglucosamine phosphorylase